MHLMQIFLPVGATHNFMQELRGLRRLLTDEFGGVTIYSQAPAEGDWRASEGAPVEQDALIILETMAAEFDRDWWRSLKSELEVSLQQREVLIRALPMERI